MLDTHPDVDFVEYMSAYRPLIFRLRIKAVRELGAVVSQDFDDFDRQCVLQSAQIKGRKYG